jgi:hypothetical protein
MRAVGTRMQSPVGALGADSERNSCRPRHPPGPVSNPSMLRRHRVWLRESGWSRVEGGDAVSKYACLTCGEEPSVRPGYVLYSCGCVNGKQAKRCDRCERKMHHLTIPCPDDRPGCLVSHGRWVCAVCEECDMRAAANERCGL